MPPVASKKPVPAPKPMSKLPAAPPPPVDEVVYPTVEVKIFSHDGGKGPLRAEDAAELLGWETEEAYSQRVGVPTKFGDEYMLKDVAGNKVRCSHNARNRPFNENWANALSQDILQGNWEFNLETIIISKLGTVLSGQHRLVALVLAAQRWAGNEKYHWEAIWQSEPTIDVLVAFGGREDAKTLRTLDNVRPRVLSDVFYTSELFKDRSSVEKKECARMLAHATDKLWERTCAKSDWVKFQTHSESVSFVERHPKIVDCVFSTFNKNRDRQLSMMKLIAGHCAAIMYLQGCSDSDNEEYSVGQPPSELLLKWGYWEKAQEFWSLLSNTKDDTLQGIRQAISDLVEEEEGSRSKEKLCIISKGWLLWINDEPVAVEELQLAYVEKEGVKVLDEFPDVGGIDMWGSVQKKPEATPSPAEVAKAAAEERSKRIKDMEKTAKSSSPTTAAKGDEYLKMLEELNSYKEKHKDTVLLFKSSSGGFNARAGDATAIALLLGKKTERHSSGMYQFSIKDGTQYNDVVGRLIAEKRKVAIVYSDGKVEPVSSPPKASKPAGTPAKPALRGGTGGPVPTSTGPSKGPASLPKKA